MGSRVQKIAFLIFALMFVAIMAILNTSILTLGSSANSQLTATVTSNDSSLSIYDQNSVYGSSVISCAKKPSEVGSTIQTVIVFTKDDNAGYAYTDTNSYKADKHGSSYGTAEGLVNNTAKFDSYLCYNANNICTGVLFIQQGMTVNATAAMGATNLATGTVTSVAGLN